MREERVMKTISELIEVLKERMYSVDDEWLEEADLKLEIINFCLAYEGLKETSSKKESLFDFLQPSDPDVVLLSRENGFINTPINSEVLDAFARVMAIVFFNKIPAILLMEFWNSFHTLELREEFDLERFYRLGMRIAFDSDDLKLSDYVAFCSIGASGLVEVLYLL